MLYYAGIRTIPERNCSGESGLGTSSFEQIEQDVCSV